jgi:hypothetical protein
MKVNLCLVALVAFGALGASSSHAEFYASKGKAAAHPAHVTSSVSRGSRQGSVGGPASKPGRVNGTGSKHKH